ncbi:sulfate transport system permease protein CysW [Klebsiella pneumoniae]|uniref:Sulfate transport system permease protein CysW n=1 Tax=Klebsiella pneumoniae TaxID=573 RepID=A0A377WLU7_KLEPN|nr:sulfate transport system permease protein CysW [Klebsiella pneumoniae]
MAEVTQLKRYDAPRINWGKWFLIGVGMLVSAFILVVPMLYIFIQAFSKGLMPVLENLANPDMLHAIWLTVMIALITVPVNLVFGTLLAWLVTRFTFPGRQLLLTLLDIPFAVSPVVAGLVYLLFYGSNGPLGGWLDAHNLQIMFAWPGMVLATIFVTCPFVVRELVPVMMSQGSHEDEAAVLLGASGWQMFPPGDVAQYSLGAAVRRGADQRPRHRRIWRGVGGFRLDPRRNAVAAAAN